MEFHISREVREKLGLDYLLFSYTGNVVFANVAGARRLAQGLTALAPQSPIAPSTPVPSSPWALSTSSAMPSSPATAPTVDPDGPHRRPRDSSPRKSNAAPSSTAFSSHLRTHFPNTSIYRGDLRPPQQWLAGTTPGELVSNREAAFEELMLLWLANQQPRLHAVRTCSSPTAGFASRERPTNRSHLCPPRIFSATGRL